ncbi:arylesterase [Mesorhizobium koreense]|uniref:arylesterase n=1 Tax=Mesorhizobium koreense TaxID=3074855 RepID=UPI00287BB088|nr:arylesterase [Mesorhizobium sp. WR6]
MAAFKILFRALLVAIMAALAVAPAAADPVSIVGMGDSLMAGYELGPGEPFAAKLQDALKKNGYYATVTNAGVSGDTTSDGQARLDWSVPDGTDLVILELGSNDMLRGIDPALTKKNLEAMIERLRARDIKVVLFGMKAAPNLGPDYQKAFDAIYPDLAAEYSLPLYPFFLDGVAGHPDLQLKDGMHPNAKGVDRIVSGALPIVEKALGKPGKNS